MFCRSSRSIVFQTLRPLAGRRRYTFLGSSDRNKAEQIKYTLKKTGQEIPEELAQILGSRGPAGPAFGWSVVSLRELLARNLHRAIQVPRGQTCLIRSIEGSCFVDTFDSIKRV